MTISNENESYAMLLCSHTKNLARRLRTVPDDKLDWTPNLAAPSMRTVSNHMLQWMMCDRQHILEPDAMQHAAIPSAPLVAVELADAIDEETSRWRTLLLSLTPEQLDEPRKQFNDYPMTVREFVCHIIQNSIYKHGQFSELYFALELDGAEPYSAPFPNLIYAEIGAAGVSESPDAV